MSKKMQDLSLLVEYMEGKWSADDFRDILLSDESLCERVRVSFAEATCRDVNIISQISAIKPNSPTADEYLCGIIGTILDHYGIEYNKKAKTKARRKSLKKAYLQNEEKSFLDGMPMTKKLFLKLFDYLDERLCESGCDHTLSITTEFLKNNGIDVRSAVDWIADHGGGCDCEVLYNLEEYFE